MKELLVDTILFNPNVSKINENISSGKVIVSGVLQRAEAKNQNGRVYPKEILMREVKKYAEIGPRALQDRGIQLCCQFQPNSCKIPKQQKHGDWSRETLQR